jgi:hypothetical protein
MERSALSGVVDRERVGKLIAITVITDLDHVALPYRSAGWNKRAGRKRRQGEHNEENPL